ncbi:hypothetical protein BRADI_3g33534v3 [Brachypodium distachyon]|uniref:Uncharacterized protein n=1 Tax=Brachypodium distachyon TaxID=15368 RepID=A0A2K2D0U5_BRADI|nr:hypothetical protein BRADI_3g33534v3 [Brachypodium distachyon]
MPRGGKGTVPSLRRTTCLCRRRRGALAAAPKARRQRRGSARTRRATRARTVRWRPRPGSVDDAAPCSRFGRRTCSERQGKRGSGDGDRKRNEREHREEAPCHNTKWGAITPSGARAPLRIPV